MRQSSATRLLVSLVLLMIAPRARAQTARDDVPPIVRIGFDSLKSSGLTTAVAAWLRGSPAEDPSAPDQLVRSLGPALDKFGPYIGYDIISVVPIGEHVRRAYAVIRFDRGPLYAYFDCYLRTDGWVIPGFLFNAQPQFILPAGMLAPATSAHP